MHVGWLLNLLKNMICFNLFNARPYAKQLHELVLKCLFDEQYEVRIAAMTTLSGLYQCCYIKVTDEDLVGWPSFFRMLKQIFVFVATEALWWDEQNQLFYENRWQESHITKKYCPTTWWSVCVSMHSNNRNSLIWQVLLEVNEFTRSNIPTEILRLFLSV